MIENIKILDETQQNEHYDPQFSNNGGGYDQPYIEYSFTRNGKEYICIVDDTSCGDFGKRFSIGVLDNKENTVYSYSRDDLDEINIDTAIRKPKVFDEDFLKDIKELTGYNSIELEDKIDSDDIAFLNKLEYEEDIEQTKNNIISLAMKKGYDKTLEESNNLEDNFIQKFTENTLANIDELIDKRFSTIPTFQLELYIKNNSEDFGIEMEQDKIKGIDNDTTPQKFYENLKEILDIKFSAIKDEVREIIGNNTRDDLAILSVTGLKEEYLLKANDFFEKREEMLNKNFDSFAKKLREKQITEDFKYDEENLYKIFKENLRDYGYHNIKEEEIKELKDNFLENNNFKTFGKFLVLSDEEEKEKRSFEKNKEIIEEKTEVEIKKLDDFIEYE